MKLVSWNVAGFRACLNKGFENFFNDVDADVICLQESKLTQDQLTFHPEGYYEYLYPAVRKGYSGTLVYSRIKPINCKYGIGVDEFDSEGRTITLEYDDFYLVTCYHPNAKRDLSRLESRMFFEDKYREYLRSLDKIKPVVVCGDFNVAHTEADIKNAKANVGNAGFTFEERNKFSELLDSGFIDTYRYFNPDETDAYTWWSYIGHARDNNIGWRLDYFLVSNRFIDSVNNPKIYSDILGSDHCPIGIEVTKKR